MDMVSLRLANALVGNRANEAALECTMTGPILNIHEAACIAICGADMRPQLDGVTLPMNRPVFVPAGSRLALGTAVAGFRAYVAVAGGFQTPLVLGGRGAYPAAGLPELTGRALKAGDELPYTPISNLGNELDTRWYAAPVLPLPDSPIVNVRVVMGPEWGELSEASQQALLNEAFHITSESNRMGYRLKGASKLSLTAPMEMASEAVALGTVQLPPGGEPIVLMADRQTTGGYPRLLNVIAADIPLLAQADPGTALRFQLVSLEEAVALYAIQQRELRLRELMIARRIVEKHGGEQ